MIMIMTGQPHHYAFQILDTVFASNQREFLKCYGMLEKFMG